MFLSLCKLRTTPPLKGASSVVTQEAPRSVEGERLFCACAQTRLPFRHPDRERRDGPSAALLESPEKIRPGIPILVSSASVAGLMWRGYECARVRRRVSVKCVWMWSTWSAETWRRRAALSSRCCSALASIFNSSSYNRTTFMTMFDFNECRISSTNDFRVFKGVVHSQNRNVVIIYSPRCLSCLQSRRKKVFFFFFEEKIPGFFTI